jgi:hypothetical protein
MKKIILFLMAAVLIGAVACQKTYYYGPRPNNSLNNGGNVSNADAAKMVANSLSVSTNGVVNIVGDVTLDAASLIRTHAGCGTTQADTISRQSPAGSSTTYTYNSKYNYTVNCGSNNKPDSLLSSLIYSGSNSTSSMSSSNSGSSIFKVAGLDSAATSFVVNGEYKSSGSFASKTDTASHGNNNIDIVITSLTITKASRSITSGTGTISVTGDTPKSGSFSYTGTLVFNGNNVATLTLNGKTYKINLYTGIWTSV